MNPLRHLTVAMAVILVGVLFGCGNGGNSQSSDSGTGSNGSKSAKSNRPSKREIRKHIRYDLYTPVSFSYKVFETNGSTVRVSVEGTLKLVEPLYERVSWEEGRGAKKLAKYNLNVDALPDLEKELPEKWHGYLVIGEGGFGGPALQPTIAVSTSKGMAQSFSGDIFLKPTVDGWERAHADIDFELSPNGDAKDSIERKYPNAAVRVLSSDKMDDYLTAMQQKKKELRRRRQAEKRREKERRRRLRKELTKRRSERVQALEKLAESDEPIPGALISSSPFSEGETTLFTFMPSRVDTQKTDRGRIAVELYGNIKWIDGQFDVSQAHKDDYSHEPNARFAGECFYRMNSEDVICQMQLQAWDTHANGFTGDDEMTVRFDGKSFQTIGDLSQANLHWGAKARKLIDEHKANEAEMEQRFKALQKFLKKGESFRITVNRGRTITFEAMVAENLKTRRHDGSIIFSTYADANEKTLNFIPQRQRGRVDFKVAISGTCKYDEEKGAVKCELGMALIRADQLKRFQQRIGPPRDPTQRFNGESFLRINDDSGARLEHISE
jgi:hypothetical protein